MAKDRLTTGSDSSTLPRSTRSGLVNVGSGYGIMLFTEQKNPKNLGMIFNSCLIIEPVEEVMQITH